MLRRPATVITLTADDIAAYEANRQRRIQSQQNRQGSELSSFDGSRDGKSRADPNDELKPTPQEKARSARTREERIMGGGSRA
ncbi:hypothetical protein H2201_000738 [Coniosporium apollinis]|uniref:Anaphase-promoting complex, subunit CDC26 n=2 Tax=Coniosporium TaxID=2810619 RepID=A0ABQ9P2R4_9PEZI|nr:hypothetical protein H2199_001256 [Cladosporium sp. JES 115]KAJ9668912.1 hypothetical protein H2201_000738 [Coniosporium apollinis]